MPSPLPNVRQLAPLYDPSYEHDACGVGLVVDIAGRQERGIVELALAGLVNLTHRGGVGADARTGDGAGLLTQIPHALFTPELARLGHTELGPGDYAVAMVFLPQDPAEASEVSRLLEHAMLDAGLPLLGWREVPIDPTILGAAATATMPIIRQLFIRRALGLASDSFERALFLARKAAERAVSAAGIEGFFLCSCSARTLIYKGFCLPQDLAAFYIDLRDPAYTSAIALFHQRYSTNTFPTWELAQPFRFIAHNGEINTVNGNRRWMEARGAALAFPDGTSGEALSPLISWTGSDSLSLDNTLELLHHGGRSLPHALMMCVPEPWEQLPEMPAPRRDFYDFHAGLMEQWDGPAALAFSDGVIAGATLDRNGLRPLRYTLTDSGLFIAGSEAGTVVRDPASIIEKGRLGPGQMIVVDTSRSLLLKNDDIKAEVASTSTYATWLAENRIHLTVQPVPKLDIVPSPPHPAATPPTSRAAPDTATIALQRALGYTAEDIRLIIQPMAGEAKEPTWSMGDDAPLAVLSDLPRPLSAYFRQRFAQVTNPAIDSLRERRVMALDTFLGPRGNPLIGEPSQARLIHLPSIVLGPGEWAAFAALSTMPDLPFGIGRLSTRFILASESLESALHHLLAAAETAILDGAGLLLLSDRGLDQEHATVPMLLAAAAIHHHLIREGLRLKTDLVVETGEVWDNHHLCALIGYGVSAVDPYLAMDTAAALAGTRGFEDHSPSALRANYRRALENGFLKVTAKMGISTASGYRGAQIFEAIGLDQTLIDRYFTGTPSRLGGIGLAEIEADIRRRHNDAYAENASKLPDLGLTRYRKEGEVHAFNPPLVKALQHAVLSNDPADYATYHAQVKAQPPTAIRDLLAFKPLGKPVPLADVEPAADLIRRFVVTAMSLGALSPEAYRTLAIAMNRLGARSNSGEGGEDPRWYDETGDIPHSKVKQVASARFGVTARYLAKAEELEIKISQGSKPGEGGQLPGHKVTPFIATLRHAVPGLPLISPPPHHDIYSIEDLAQLIYDLRQINPRAKIGVKLVAEAGVGTIAAGVAKARADYILISGHSGGTGASPLASIKHAGCPWELGLAETQQTLVMNDLRSRVTLRTDGGLKTPEDLVVAAMLGAEEFGFGTSVLVAIGCDMARQCHLNTCPTGIATQRDDLRAKYTGTPEMVIAYFERLAEATRELLASLGARSIDDLVGRADLLTPRGLDGRAALLDLTPLLAQPVAASSRKKTLEIDHHAAETLDQRILAEIGPALQAGLPVEYSAPIVTENRATGARVAGTIALLRDENPTPIEHVTLSFTGSAGQSFGAFTVAGMTLRLEGEANDYVAKGMSGGEIAIFPSRHAPFT
ncbi:MAG: glutamate synthase large subunit, partial [Chloroflexota bacterium]|nr:glutamate synthase large subunit [Chloroflexota bacterium]